MEWKTILNSTIIVLYYGGFHGEFFIGNIVTNTDKFQYDYFKYRSKMLNAYQYEVIKSFDAAKIPIPGDIKTKNKNWTSLSQVELTNTSWSTRSVGSSIDDIIDVATLTFNIPIYITPPAKLKQQKLIHTIISQLYSLDDDDLDNFRKQEVFSKETLKYTIVTYKDKKARYLDGNLQILNEESYYFVELGEINNRNWNIKNTIEWKKFIHGE